MKQTVEKASIEYVESVIRSFGTCGVPNGISDIKEMIANGFNSGSDWQSKQSPWISVEERLPEQNELVLCRMVSNEAIVSGFIIPTPSGRPRVVTLPDFEFEDYGDYVCDMWTPIPSFDEILEANKDVLSIDISLKRKGDEIMLNEQESQNT